MHRSASTLCHMASATGPVELRVLTGPNLYFSRPAIKLTLDAGAALAAEAPEVLRWHNALRVLGAPVGLPGSDARAIGVAAMAAALVRRCAGTLRIKVLAVSHPGDDDTVIVAFPAHYEIRSRTFALAVAEAFAAICTGTPVRRALAGVGPAVRAVEAGPEILAIKPRIPVVAVTGTNGKTTTTRLIAHLVRAGGRTPGWSSTDGIYIDGVEVESGDWSGPGGAGRVLSDPSVQVAVTETARGGILLRGLGTAANDVSVVTNISADHLGLLGVHTVEQLAEVKSVIVRVTKPTGWCVLNAEDPLVVDMRRLTRARLWMYATDPTNPHLVEALEAGGRAITVIDGNMVVLQRGADPVKILALQEIPLTLAGASRVNVANALAASAAALAIGVKREDLRSGLRTFGASAQHNAGRLNSYLVGDTVIILDLAHNEASLQSLLEVAEAMRLPGGDLVAVVSTAGDRTDDAIHAMGAMAAAAADRLVIAGKSKYLRGREPGAMESIWAAGAAEAGVADAPRATGELVALQDLLAADLPAGSAIAICTLEERQAIIDHIDRLGGHELSPTEIAARVAEHG